MPGENNVDILQITVAMYMEYEISKVFLKLLACFLMTVLINSSLFLEFNLISMNEHYLERILLNNIARIQNQTT